MAGRNVELKLWSYSLVRLAGRNVELKLWSYSLVRLVGRNVELNVHRYHTRSVRDMGQGGGGEEGGRVQVYEWLARSTTTLASRFGLAVRLVSGRTSVRYRFGSPFSSKKVVVCGHCLVTLSLTINETLKWLSSLTISMQESVILVVTV